jgi:hypothetical protein
MIFDVFLEGHCAKDEYRLCFFWVGGWVIFLQQRLLNELQANFFRELIFWRRYVLANRPLFAFFGLCSFVENFKGSVGTANRQATQKNMQTMWLGLAKRKFCCILLQWVCIPSMCFFRSVSHWIAILCVKKGKWASGKRTGAISKRLLCIHAYLFVVQIMVCVIGSWCEADWPWGTCANFASSIFNAFSVCV